MATATLGATLDSWLANVTQTFGQNGEHGVDVGLPYGTPVYAPTGGTVLSAGYDPQIGGVVSWQAPITYGGINGPASLYLQHLSTVLVSAGQRISAGQLVGYSGGQLGYGNHPNTPNVSTGPHIEFGINSPAQGGVNLWRAQGPNVNPLGFLQALAQGDQSVATSTNTSSGAASGGGSGTPWWQNIPFTPPWWLHVGQNAANGAGQAVDSAAAIPQAIVTATAGIGTLFTEGAKRAAFFVIAIVIIVMGVWILAEPGMRERAQEAVKVAAAAGG